MASPAGSAARCRPFSPAGSTARPQARLVIGFQGPPADAPGRQAWYGVFSSSPLGRLALPNSGLRWCSCMGGAATAPPSPLRPPRPCGGRAGVWCVDRAAGQEGVGNGSPVEAAFRALGLRIAALQELLGLLQRQVVGLHPVADVRHRIKHRSGARGVPVDRQHHRGAAAVLPAPGQLNLAVDLAHGPAEPVLPLELGAQVGGPAGAAGCHEGALGRAQNCPSKQEKAPAAPEPLSSKPCWGLNFSVEPSGLEPLTPCMPCRCSTS